ncbi:dTDP-glucose 4,6-dehydratase [Candidatus Pacearchaeota archaeon]|nr:dTDP-glucose 4,6-dehydratase [Candidatus Pacearchaeota archaeon]
MKVMVTGGSGFIGGNFIKYLLTDSEVPKDIQIINIDNLTYAGIGRNIEHMKLSSNPNYSFVKADICDKNEMDKIFSKHNPDIIFNFAAESHVDRSIVDSDAFERTNFLGACNIFKLAIKNNIKKFIHISTDEVYGSIKEGSFSEDSKLNPSSAYSATKAAADLMALAFHKTYGFPVIVTRSANNYGPYQFPEKIMPLFITNLIEDKKVPLMFSDENPGLNVRDWLHVEDNCKAIWFVANNGNVGEVYTIPGENELPNIDITRIILNQFGLGDEMIEKIPHRKGHDFRYSIKGDKLKTLGFEYSHKNLQEEIKKLVDWYKNNADWWRPLKK